MKHLFPFSISSFLILLLSACTTTGFRDYYKPFYEETIFSDEAYLKEGEIPQVIMSSNLDSELREIASNWHLCIGSTGFNGTAMETSEINAALINLCKEKKAKIAVWTKAYTNTKNGVYSVPQTNYHTYRNAYGYTSSYTTTTYIPYSYSIDRYDFEAYLFISIPSEYKDIFTPGFSIRDLEQYDRDTYRQNTGCLINVVYKNTPAFFANLTHGDIITAVNGTQIFTAEDFIKYKKNIAIGDTLELTIVRNGIEKKIKLQYKL